MNKILAVDKKIDYHNEVSKIWKKYEINVKRVDTMHEGIKELINNDDYLFIAINEDSIPDFMLQLRLMRDVTSTPIFVITSSYTIDKNISAMKNGADEYAPFDINPEKNVIAALETLKAQKRLRRSCDKELPILVEGNIILSLSQRIIFINNIEISLTKKEFEILYFLMSNVGYVVTHGQLLKKVWGVEYNEYDVDVLWKTVNRLRSKLSKISNNKYIKIERGIGYRFLCEDA